MNPIQLTLTVVPIETQVSFGNGNKPIRNIRFKVIGADTTELLLDDSFPLFDDIWESVNKDIRQPQYIPPDKYITQL